MALLGLRWGQWLRLLVLLAAEFSCGGEGLQRPLLVGLAEGVGTQLAEGLRVLTAHITVVPWAVPTTCITARCQS